MPDDKPKTTTPSTDDASSATGSMADNSAPTPPPTLGATDDSSGSTTPPASTSSSPPTLDISDAPTIPSPSAEPPGLGGSGTSATSTDEPDSAPETMTGPNAQSAGAPPPPPPPGTGGPDDIKKDELEKSMGKKKKRIDKRIVAGALGVLLIVASVGAGIILVQQSQGPERASEVMESPTDQQRQINQIAIPIQSREQASCDNRLRPRCGPGDNYDQVFNATECSSDPNDDRRFCCPEGQVVSQEYPEFYYCKVPFTPDQGQHQCYLSQDGTLSRVNKNLFYEPIQFFPPDDYGNVYDATIGEKVKLGATIRNLTNNDIPDRIGFHAYRVDESPPGNPVDESTQTVPVGGVNGGQTDYTTEGVIMRNHFYSGANQSEVYFTPWIDHTFTPGDNVFSLEWTAGEANRGGNTTPTCGIFQVDLIVESFGQNICGSYVVAAGFVRVSCEEEPTPSPGTISCQEKVAYRDDPSNTAGSYDFSDPILPGETVSPGEAIVFKVSANNVPPGQTYDISDYLNEDLEYMDSIGGCGYNTATRTVSCSNFSLGDMSFRARVVDNPTGSTIDNTAVFSTSSGQCSVSIPLEGQPTPSPTSSPGTGTAMCTDVKAYTVDGDPQVLSNWTQLSASDLAALDAGDEVYFTVLGSTNLGFFSKARFTINGVTRPEVTTTKPSGTSGSGGLDGPEGTDLIVPEYYDVYIIPAGTTGFQIIGEVFHSQLGWL